MRKLGKRVETPERLSCEIHTYHGWEDGLKNIACCHLVRVRIYDSPVGSHSSQQTKGHGSARGVGTGAAKESAVIAKAITRVTKRIAENIQWLRLLQTVAETVENWYGGNKYGVCYGSK